MKNYKTSKDYRLLKKLLDGGNTVVVLFQYDGEQRGGLARKVDDHGEMMYDIDTDYQNSEGMTEDQFVSWMEHYDSLEFIVPDIV